ncbi:MAG TPA: dicarboxylate/amino acid:cation symporter [Methylococcaceae bacterium]|nr:dicarboxylate/amino acid:cation symporter [Methylococcaceae bacterium]
MRLSLNTKILLGAFAGLMLGLGLANLAPDAPFRVAALSLCGIIGQVFIDLLKMVLIPLIFLSIAAGVANLAGHAHGRRVWRLTLLFFLTTTTLAVGLGLLVANVFRPGEGLDVASFREAMGSFNTQKLTLGEFAQKFAHGLFLNPVAAMAQGEVLATVIFALFAGAGLVACGERTQGLLKLLNEAWVLIMEIVGWIMLLAPLGIFALLAKLAATQSAELLAGLGKFVVVVLGSTLFHGVVVLPLLLYAAAGVSPRRFFAGSREALLTAFATASSSATMPVTLSCAKHNFKIDPGVSGFVIPLGTTVNMDGTALYEAAAALFVAQLSGIDLNLLQQCVVFFIAMLAAIGAPGIPSAGMVTLAMVLQSVGLPVEAIAILLPIDRLLDAFRTAVNVEGDLIGSLVVQRWIGEPDSEKG